jgi:hypothetical protein
MTCLGHTHFLYRPVKYYFVVLDFFIIMFGTGCVPPTFGQKPASRYSHWARRGQMVGAAMFEIEREGETVIERPKPATSGRLKTSHL